MLVDHHRNHMKLLKYPFYFLAAIFILFEEWLWFRLLRVMQAFTSLPIVRAIDPFVRKQNKWVALALFAIPELTFIPVKMGVFWLFGAGHAFIGTILFVAAKVAGTATFAWMWDMTEPKITELAWVRWIQTRVLMLRLWAHLEVTSSEAYHATMRMVDECRAQYRVWQSQREHWSRRKFRAAMVVAKRKA